MSIHNRLELRNSSNVLGIIRGAVEPGERPLSAPRARDRPAPSALATPPSGPGRLRPLLTPLPSPDRYVLYGNHRDSWVHGAVDPSSGTAVLLELSRVLGTLLKKGEAAPLPWSRDSPLRSSPPSPLLSSSGHPVPPPPSHSPVPTCAKPEGPGDRHARTPALASSSAVWTLD